MRIREYRRAIAGVRVAVPSAPYSLQDIWSSKRTSGRSSGGPYRIYQRILGTVSFRPLLKAVDATLLGWGFVALLSEVPKAQ
jgi:hypothetical protein